MMKQQNHNLDRNQSMNAWKMIYRLMDNIKTYMDSTYQDKQGKINADNVDNIIDYINNSLQNITKNTIEK